MRRVSSRQRLVSWDAFDATVPDADDDANFSDSDNNDNDVIVVHPPQNDVDADNSITDIDDDDDDDDDDYDVGYDTALEDINSGSHHDLTTLAASQDATLVGRKRDRSTRRAFASTPSSPITHIQAASSSSPQSIIKAAQQTQNAFIISPLAFPPLIPSHKWEQGQLEDDQNLVYSASTNTLSSFVTTSSTLVPNLLPTPSSASSVSLLHWNDLTKDVHVAVFAFLDLTSLQSVMAVNHTHRRLVLSHDAQTSLWNPLCQRAWRLGRRQQQPLLQQEDGGSSLRYLDRMHLPTAATTTAKAGTPNLPLLLHMTPDQCPTGVDEALLETQNARIERLRPLNGFGDANDAEELLLRMRMRRAQQQQQAGVEASLRSYTKNGRTLVKYVGPIGAGDRCIRSDHPLPRPKQPEPLTGATTSGNGSALSKPRFLVNLLRRGAHKMVTSRSSSSLSQQQQQRSTWRPFVVPFMENSTTVNVTPRLMSYYEVTILDFENSGNDDTDDDSITGPAAAAAQPTTGQRPDCVAVGLATESFHVHSRMPGWDRQSFGYHGDDGGIFHSSGTMVKQFGSKFGAGDTVGCGIDYVNQGIFFTLNGRFLGYGWKGIEEELLQHAMYPVVGLDTNCPLFLNFGADEPFQFDFSQFIMKHETIIALQYTLDTPTDAVAAPSTIGGNGKLSREPSMLSFPSTSSLASMASTSSSSNGRRRFRRRGGRSTVSRQTAAGSSSHHGSSILTF